MSDALAGKRALVTGASAGIGLTTAKLFAEQGAVVAGLAPHWSELPSGIDCIVGDVASHADVASAVEQAGGEEGLDILIANAGIAFPQDWLTGDPDVWMREIDVNLLGVMRCFQAAASNMINHQRKGRLLATSSTSGLRAWPHIAAYCASKAGVVSVVESAAIAFAGYGITANTVAPGSVDTEMQWQVVRDRASAQGRSAADVHAEMTAAIPLGRWAHVSEVADVFLFLASDSAAYLTGQTIRVDGGRLLV